MKPEFSRQILKKSSNIKFYENPSSSSCSMRKGGQTDMMKSIITFRDFVKEPKNGKDSHTLINEDIRTTLYKQHLIPVSFIKYSRHIG
jgi:hypothetical protein